LKGVGENEDQTERWCDRETIDPKYTILSESAESIDLTDQKSSALRTMQEIADESKHHFANVINALKLVLLVSIACQ
jgi:hypothetical protein